MRSERAVLGCAKLIENKLRGDEFLDRRRSLIELRITEGS
jgi:hypothetical protein